MCLLCGSGLGQVDQIVALGAVVVSRITARVNWPVAVGTGLKLISTGNVAPSLRMPTRRALPPIGRAVGACA